MSDSRCPRNLSLIKERGLTCMAALNFIIPKSRSSIQMSLRNFIANDVNGKFFAFTPPLQILLGRGWPEQTTKAQKLNIFVPRVAALVAITLFGCASTGVIPMDRDSYMIAKKDGTPGFGISLSNKADVYREANAFCRAKELEVETLQVTTKPAMPGVLGYTELQFRCVSPSLATQPVSRFPDEIIENNRR